MHRSELPDESAARGGFLVSRFAIDGKGRHVLLLLLHGASTVVATLPDGEISPDDGEGPVPAGFAVEAAEFAA